MKEQAFKATRFVSEDEGKGFKCVPGEIILKSDMTAEQYSTLSETKAIQAVGQVEHKSASYSSADMERK